MYTVTYTYYITILHTILFYTSKIVFFRGHASNS